MESYSEVKDRFEFSVEFQSDLVAYLLSDKDIFRKYTKHIIPEYFTEYQLVDLMGISLEFFEKYQEIPTKSSLINEITLSKKEINTYIEYIDTIYKFSYNKNYVKDSLVKFIKVQAIYKGLKEAYNNMEKSDEVIHIIEESVRKGKNLEFDSGYDYKDNIKKRIECLNRKERVNNQIPTLMLGIDRNTGGGIGAGELAIVVAKTGSGKTIFLCNIAVAACAIGKNVVYFTLEASEDLLAGRIDCNISKYYELEKQEKLDKLISSVSRLEGELKIKELPSEITTSIDIANYVGDLIDSGFKPDLVIVDYLKLMASVRKFKETRESIGSIARGLINHIGKRFKIPVWTAHQSSETDTPITISKTSKYRREVENLIGISGVSEAKVALSSEADFMISLNQTPEEEIRRPFQGLRLYIMKNRLGPDHVIIPMEIDKARSIIRELSCH